MAAQLAADFPGIYCLSDSGIPLQDIETYRVSLELPARGFLLAPCPRVDLGAAEIVVFTSGSTGTPIASQEVTGVARQDRPIDRRPLRPLGERYPGHRTAPAYVRPGDFGRPAALGQCFGAFRKASLSRRHRRRLGGVAETPRILVTTPIHMNALVTAKTALPPLQKVISATAPLTPELAATVEADYDTAVFEIFGFSEAGTVATRRTLAGPRWQTCDGLVLRQDQEWLPGRRPTLPGAGPGERRHRGLVARNLSSCAGALRTASTSPASALRSAASTAFSPAWRASRTGPSFLPTKSRIR